MEYMLGTPRKIVAPVAAMEFATRSGSKRVNGTIVQPCRIGKSMPTVAAKE